MSKRKAKEVKQWSVPMRLEFNVHVLVEAATQEEAEAKAEANDNIDYGLNAGECVNWERTGSAKCED